MISQKLGWKDEALAGIERGGCRELRLTLFPVNTSRGFALLAHGVIYGLLTLINPCYGRSFGYNTGRHSLVLHIHTSSVWPFDDPNSQR